MFDTIHKNVHSFQKALDIYLVYKKAKPCFRVLIHDDEIKSFIELIKKLNLCYAIASYKLDLHLDPHKHFSNKASIITSDKKGHCIVFGGHDESLVKKAKNAEENHDHIALGKVLGYPSCCNIFFDKNFAQESKKINEYILCSKVNTINNNWILNVMLRCFDVSLLSHFPCSLDCSESQKIGNFYLEHLDNDIQSFLKEKLSVAVLYTETKGVFIFDDWKLDGNIFSYENIISSTDNEVLVFLKEKKSFTIINPNTLVVGDTRFDNIVFSIFE